MTNTYLTGNPLGSTNPKDLSDNASNFDEVLNSTSPSFDDRFGKRRETLAGMQYEFDSAQAAREQEYETLLSSLGYQDMGTYAAGIVLTRRNQVFQRNGVYYRPGSTVVFPYTLTGNWTTEGSKFVLMGDDVIRQDLANATDMHLGMSLVGGGERAVADYTALRALPNDSIKLAFVVSTSSHWKLDPSDTSSAENLDTGIIVAADGGRWKIQTGTGISRAQAGKPGTIYNDWGYIWGYGMSGVNINGNGNKFNYTSIYIESDQVVQQIGLNGATGSKVDGFNVTMLSGGPTTRGGRHAIDGVLILQAPTDSNNLDRNYVGVQGQVIVVNGDGGTGPLDTRGAAFGSSSYSALTGGQYFANITAHEFNTSIEASLPGTRVAIHQGVQIASVIGQRGFNLDCALGISALGGSNYGFQYGICFHGLNGAPAFSADSTVIKVATTSTSSGTVNILFDGSGVVFNQLIKTDQVNLRAGVLDLATAGSVVSLGSAAVAGTVQVQGKTGALGASWDGRLFFSGGTATVGQGLAQIDAAVLATSATSLRPTAAGLTTLGAASLPFAGAYLQTAPIITSDVRKKTAIEPLSLGLEFVESLAAADQGLIQFKMVQGGQSSAEQEIVGYNEVSVPEMEEYEEQETYIEMVDGAAVQKTRTVTKTRPLYDQINVVDENGMNVMVEAKRPVGTEEYIDDDGRTRTRTVFETYMEQKVYEQPRMTTVQEPIYATRAAFVSGERTHLGLSAQELRAQLLKFGMADCAAWCLEDPEDEESAQSVRETQLISVLLKAVAELSEKVKALTKAAE